MTTTLDPNSTSDFDPTGDWTSHKLADTFLLGKWIGEHLRGGEIILLDGALGAGKTIFVKGVGSALGLDFNEVTSPSFTLVNRYDAHLTLYHLDLYRLTDGVAAAYAVDLDELLSEERAVIVIEWAERLRNYPLPAPVYRVRIEGDGEEVRHIRIVKE
ncbi:MAG TPA: tRNA (adenosine(37)-N6)-threonylcarbamoyltransferase complex ATPase subunit type 1 TsaE [Pyrinomonadaceae bacterium]|nr:tRNA (adenosine(37)-N6)-threonylcarbamoyltransferase complex ATPase subunit type 1 TsaE [Pyrinomonadaceae bacterium]